MTHSLQIPHMPKLPQGEFFDINAIKRIIPHRYPMLLIDRVVIVEQLKKAIGYKCVSGNEEYFTGHFPSQPIMPGVLIIEAMAQVAGIMAFLASDEITREKVTYFMAIDNARFRKPVSPGDQLRIEVTTTMNRRGIWGVAGKAFVGDVLVTEADLKATFADSPK